MGISIAPTAMLFAKFVNTQVIIMMINKNATGLLPANMGAKTILAKSIIPVSSAVNADASTIADPILNSTSQRTEELATA